MIGNWVYVVAALATLVTLTIMTIETGPFPMYLTIAQAVQRLQSPGLDAASLTID